MSAHYDRIGTTYAHTRREDPRIAARIEAALGDAASVVNVGAGTGSYEPPGRDVVAVEPSATMIAQRPPGAAPCIQGSAESLPFGDGAFDAALAVLTMHHWRDQAAGLAELRRVARDRVVVLTWDPAYANAHWLVAEYLSGVVDRDVGRFWTPGAVAAALGGARIEPVPIPHDCHDGFLGAFWRRPEAYLDPEVRAGMSVFHFPGAEDGLARLEADLESGAWAQRHAGLLAREQLDLGYRLLIAD
jgi:SAM-dependent methyltransferase